VKKLHCSHNLLIVLDSYPPDRTPLTTTTCPPRFKGIDQLSVLNCSNNELVSIENLPKSIELHCDNNNIIAIDLMDLSELGKLSIKENSDNLNILNVPSSITELLYDQNANVKVSHFLTHRRRQRPTDAVIRSRVGRPDTTPTCCLNATI
jgi:hypothetical protein